MLAVPWAGMLEGPKLQQERGPTWTTTNPVIASQDTMLNSSAENITHGSHYNLNLSKLNDVESYTLFSFPLLQNSTTGGLVPGGTSIQSASITLYTTSAQTLGGNHVYVAMLDDGFELEWPEIHPV